MPVNILVKIAIIFAVSGLLFACTSQPRLDVESTATRTPKPTNTAKPTSTPRPTNTARSTPTVRIVRTTEVPAVSTGTTTAAATDTPLPVLPPVTDTPKPEPTNTTAPQPTVPPATATKPPAQPTNTPRPAATAPPSQDVGSYPCQPGQVKGNRNSMIYHAPGQRDYERTQQNVQCFDTEAQALAAGYRKALR